jgi:DNA polymerase-3 subunit alpha
VVEDAVVVVGGYLDHRGDEVKVMAKEINELEIRDDAMVRLKAPAAKLTPDLVSRLKSILSNHPGTTPVYLNLTSDQGIKVLKLSDAHRVEPRTALFAELKELLGPSAIL